MNRESIKIGIFSIAIATSLGSCDTKKAIQYSETPTEIIEYATKHFPNHKILQTMVEMDGFIKTYQITLNDNTQLEFNRKKEIKEIDGQTALPNVVIPSKINEYVTKNFADQTITDWNLEDNGQKIKLHNGMELKFSKNGDFIRLDD